MSPSSEVLQPAVIAIDSEIVAHRRHPATTMTDHPRVDTTIATTIIIVVPGRLHVAGLHRVVTDRAVDHRRHVVVVSVRDDVVRAPFAGIVGIVKAWE